MRKKVVAIGGGMIGERSKNGELFPYETEVIDKEIISLSNSASPNILFIGFADPSYSYEYFQYFKNIFGKKYDCDCKLLDMIDLTNFKNSQRIFDWTDIIYIGGGNTYTLMSLLKKYKIDQLLKESYDNGKVMSGISAGGMVYFAYGNSVIPENKYLNNKLKLIKQQCLGFKQLVFTPHCDEPNGHFENVENLIKNESLVGISLSNCTALEIIDNKYRFITIPSERYNIEPFALKSFWKDGEYCIQDICISNEYEELDALLSISKLNESQVNNDVKVLLRTRNIYDMK